MVPLVTVSWPAVTVPATDPPLTVKASSTQMLPETVPLEDPDLAVMLPPTSAAPLTVAVPLTHTLPVMTQLPWAEKFPVLTTSCAAPDESPEQVTSPVFSSTSAIEPSTDTSVPLPPKPVAL